MTAPPCNCWSDTAQDGDPTRRPILLHDPYRDGKPTSIDRCLAPVVAALWDAGIATLSSCCGHGRTDLDGPGLVLTAVHDVPRAAAIIEASDYPRPIALHVWTLVRYTPPRER